MSNSGWIGVDLDGTLAHYDKWRGPTHIGPPVPAMLRRVRNWLDRKQNVRIFTARIATPNLKERDDIRQAIDLWCKTHIGETLVITCQKDLAMIELWDDRCVQVIPNTGKRADGKD